MLPALAPLLGAPASTQQFYIVRVDAPPGVATIAADGCFVTVESGPHLNLQLALHALQHPKQHAYSVLPDIIFLPTAATVFALNEPVPSSKPRLVVSAETVQQARSPAQRQPAPSSRGTARRARAEDVSSAGSPVGTPAAAAAAAAAASKALQLPTPPPTAPAATPAAAWQLPSLGLLQEFATSPPARRPKQQQQPSSPLSSGGMAPPALPASLPAAAAAAATPFGAAPASPSFGAAMPARAALPPLQLARAAQQVQAMLQQQLAVGQQQQQGRPLLLTQTSPGVFSMTIQTPSPKRRRADQASPTGQQAEQQQAQQQQQQQAQQGPQAAPSTQPQHAQQAPGAADAPQQQQQHHHHEEHEPLQEEPSLSLFPQVQPEASDHAPRPPASQLLPLLDPQQYQQAVGQLLQKLIKEGARPPSPPAGQGGPAAAAPPAGRLQ
ncbi:hypothetical protein ABPG75_013528 [Micractinium tetrahymenae]